MLLVIILTQDEQNMNRRLKSPICCSSAVNFSLIACSCMPVKLIKRRQEDPKFEAKNQVF
jgi:hypothetical protein